MILGVREKVTFAVAGFIIAVLIIAAISVFPMIVPSMPPAIVPPALANTGELVIKVTDKPADLKSLNITIDSFEVQNETGNWVSVTIEGGSVSFDLLQLHGVTKDVAMGDLKPGNYTMIRMHIVKASAMLTSGSIIDVRVPSDKIRIITSFEIRAGKTTTIILDIQVDTIRIASNPQHNLKPVVKATVMPPS